MAKKKIHSVKPKPNTKKETVVPYYKFAPDFFKKHFGAAPSDTTLKKYVINGFPVRRHGPYVQMPIVYELKRVKTTEEAMGRFLTVVRNLEAQAG